MVYPLPFWAGSRTLMLLQASHSAESSCPGACRNCRYRQPHRCSCTPWSTRQMSVSFSSNMQMSVNSFIKVCDVPRLPWSEHGSFYWGNKCPFFLFPADEADCHLEEHFYRNLSNRYWQNNWEILDALKILYEQNCSCLAFVEHLRPVFKGEPYCFHHLQFSQGV